MAKRGNSFQGVGGKQYFMDDISLDWDKLPKTDPLVDGQLYVTSSGVTGFDAYVVCISSGSVHYDSNTTEVG
tara:strand:- start:2624 stop:2839 length:216 start_codon:yes stop_codon:yes gene_type:complete